MCHECGSEKNAIKDCESKKNIYVTDLQRNQIIEQFALQNQTIYAKEYKHRNPTNNLSTIQGKDKRYKKTVEEKLPPGNKDLLRMWSKRTLIKSCKKKTNLFVTNEEWPDASEEELKYFLEEYGKISSIKTGRNRFLGRNEALGCYRTGE